jgi:hypothetical protein
MLVLLDLKFISSLESGICRTVMRYIGTVNCDINTHAHTHTQDGCTLAIFISAGLQCVLVRHMSSNLISPTPLRSKSQLYLLV